MLGLSYGGLTVTNNHRQFTNTFLEMDGNLIVSENWFEIKFVGIDFKDRFSQARESESFSESHRVML